MTITRCLLVLLATLTLVHGAPKKRCCEPSPDCLDPCPQPDMNYQSDQMPAADGGLYSDQQQGQQQDQLQGQLQGQQQDQLQGQQQDQLQGQQQDQLQGQQQDQLQGQQQGQLQGAPLQLEGVMEDCCQPGPACANPCQSQMLPMPPMGQAIAPPMMQPVAPPMAQPMGFAPQMGFGADCCQPAMDATCQNPCQPAAPPERTAYAPYPGEITFKLLQTWTDKYLDNTSPAFQILSGNVRKAIEAVLGPMTQVSNIYFREGYVPGNPATMPKVVAHVMVNGGSDEASRLQLAVTPGGSLGDGLKVYKDSFNAY